MSTDMNVKADKWVFTAWIRPEIKLMGTVQYMVWQKELCPTTQKLHYQGYVEFKKEYAIPYIKTLFRSKDIWLQPAKCSQEVNSNYCSKMDTKHADGESFRYGIPKLGSPTSTIIQWADLL